MTFSHNSPTPPGLDEVEDGLRVGRALPSDDEVDRIWTRVAPARAARTRARGARLALVAVLAGGVFVGGGGGALAISGNSSHGNVAAAQYAPTNPNGPQVLGQVTGGGPTPTTGVPTSTTKTATSVSPAVNGEVESTAQTAQGTVRSLPFTGFVAIPLIALGIALLGVGVVVRRRTASA
jgi:hypothetical protein